MSIGGERQADQLVIYPDVIVILVKVKRDKNMGKQIPVACCHTVFTKEQRVEYKSIWEELEIRRTEIIEIEKGYQHQFPGDSETLNLVNEWVSMERKCCPFLTKTKSRA